jgi:arylsulfatase A-like enzyme
MATPTRPNLVFIMADDHAAQAIGAYGSQLNATPHIDRIARGGMRFDACFCTNSICTPSRASILTGMYSHINGVTTLDTPWDARQPTFVTALAEAGYQTAIVGKWHLGHGGIHDPRSFDRWIVLPDQGEYHDPLFLTAEGPVRLEGYATDLITDLSLDWLARRDPTRPFGLLIHHKAPHRSWEPDEAHAGRYHDADLPVPPGFDDDHSGQAPAASEARMRMADLTESDLKAPIPVGLDVDAESRWRWRRFIEDYLACVASIDDNVGRVLDWLDEAGLADDTVVVYTSDQGFFLGEHGWFDKRFMYEESIRMPLLVRYPREVTPASATDAMVLNVDFAPTFCDLARVPIPATMQGRSLLPILRGHTPADWRTTMYYRYWMHLDPAHRVQAHLGVRTTRYKLVHYPGEGAGVPGASSEERTPAWELFDLATDPFELHSVYHDSGYASIVTDLRNELMRLQSEVGDDPAWRPSSGGQRTKEVVDP